MTTRRSILLAGFVFCFLSSLASADSVNIPITGTASQGFAITYGDFNIKGPGLSLYQALPDGPLDIGVVCDVGSVCNFSFTINRSGAYFCTYCLAYDSGSLGNKVVEFLQPSLQFTGSAFYSGGGSQNVPMILSGTIIGYELINCASNGSCSLGPKEFTLHISGTGTGQFLIAPMGGGVGVASIQGVFTNFTGTATTAVPEPISLVLTGTGLVGILIRKKIAHTERT
jgi:hypothetical protein